jgi:hypothetical protein
MHCRDFVAFVGAIGFTPMDFILPIILWQKVGKHSLIVSLINWSIVIFYSIIAIAGTDQWPVSFTVAHGTCGWFCCCNMLEESQSEINMLTGILLPDALNAMAGQVHNVQ